MASGQVEGGSVYPTVRMAHTSRRWLAMLFLTSSVVSRSAFARDCSLRFEPPDGGAGWESAAREATASLASSLETDCAEIVVAVTPRGALVRFTTTDGRTAARQVANPAELASTIVALMVTLDAGAPKALPDDGGPPSTHDAPPRPIIRAIPEWEPAPPAPPALAGSGDLSIGVRGRVGLRAGLPGPVVAPTFGVGFALAGGRWEASVFAQWEPVHVPTATTAGRVRLSATALSLSAGRRERIGGPASIVFGPSFALAIETVKAGPELGEVGRGRLAPRLGVFVAGDLEVGSAVRLRLGVAADLDPTRIGRAPDTLPALAPWGVEPSLGVEWKVP